MTQVKLFARWGYSHTSEMISWQEEINKQQFSIQCPLRRITKLSCLADDLFVGQMFRKGLFVSAAFIETASEELSRTPMNSLCLKSDDGLHKLFHDTGHFTNFCCEDSKYCVSYLCVFLRGICLAGQMLLHENKASFAVELFQLYNEFSERIDVVVLEENSTKCTLCSSYTDEPSDFRVISIENVAAIRTLPKVAHLVFVRCLLHSYIEHHGNQKPSLQASLTTIAPLNHPIQMFSDPQLHLMMICCLHVLLEPKSCHRSNGKTKCFLEVVRRSFDYGFCMLTQKAMFNFLVRDVFIQLGLYEYGKLFVMQEKEILVSVLGDPLTSNAIKDINEASHLQNLTNHNKIITRPKSDEQISNTLDNIKKHVKNIIKKLIAIITVLLKRTNYREIIKALFLL